MRADVIRDRRLDLLQCLRPMRSHEVDKHVVRAQYASGFFQGKDAPGYRREERVAADSTTETFVVLRQFIDNWRWAGVPIYIRTGKAMPKRVSEVVVRFKAVPHMLFDTDSDTDTDTDIRWSRTCSHCASNRTRGWPCARAPSCQDPTSRPIQSTWTSATGRRSAISRPKPTNACCSMSWPVTRRCSCATTRWRHPDNGSSPSSTFGQPAVSAGCLSTR